MYSSEDCSRLCPPEISTWPSPAIAVTILQRNLHPKTTCRALDGALAMCGSTYPYHCDASCDSHASWRSMVKPPISLPHRTEVATPLTGYFTPLHPVRLSPTIPISHGTAMPERTRSPQPRQSEMKRHIEP